MRNWNMRHNVVLLFLCLYIFLLLAVGSINYTSTSNILTVVLCTALYAALATSEKVTQPLRQGLAVLGLATGSSGLIYLSGGLLISHLSFALALVLAALYQEKITYLVVLSYMLFYYFIFAYINPLVVFNASEVSKETVRWSIIMFIFNITFSLPSMIAAYFSILTTKTELKMNTLLSNAALRERQAVEIHDNIVQNLVIAKYKLEDDDLEGANIELDLALRNAKIIVDGLIEGGNVNTLRDTSSNTDFSEKLSDS